MKTRVFIFITTLIGCMIATSISAVTLIDVYKKALSSDPKFKSANAQWLADKETLAIKRSVLLPQLGATAGFTRAFGASSSTNAASSINGNNTNYQLQLTQTLFDFGKWSTVWQAQAKVKKAEATFMAAIEDLLLRTSTAYFNVLQAKDVFYYTKANRESLERMLNQNKHRYEVGLISIVDLENTRANYDTSIAQEIAADNAVADSLEKLSEITGVRYLSLDQLKATFPLLSPQPANIEKWANAAEQQNFDLAAARYATIEARENIKIQNAGHLPILGANGGYSYSNNSNGSLFPGSTTGIGKSLGLSLTVPLFQGGNVLASVRQANYQYQKALADQETSLRSTISQTRQTYLGVIASISQIKANQQAIKSAQSSLRATIAGYDAGTRTMVDVLQAQAILYGNQKNFTTSEYDYINNLLTLKKYAGILDADDLAQINSWLEKQKIAPPDMAIKKWARHGKSRTSTKINKKIKTSTTIPKTPIRAPNNL